MDFHKFENVSLDDIKAAHMADVAIQEQYGVKYHQYWVNQEAGTVFCLCEGPDKETCQLVHQMAHGNMACALTEVEPSFYKAIMGEAHQVDYFGVVTKSDGAIDLGYRHILVTSVRGVKSDNLKMVTTPDWAKQIVTQALQQFGGQEVNLATGDGIVAVFSESMDVVKCAADIQRRLVAGHDDLRVVFKLGISAEQPVTEDGDFFARAIRFAQRLTSAAEDNQVLASSLVRKLSREVIPLGPTFKYLDNAEEQFISDFIDIADRNLTNHSFSIDSLCKDIGISRPQLYRKVTSLTGRAPNDFLRDLRMDKALALLKQKAGNISQIALEVGYSNPSYFSKCFSDKFGCAPSEVS